MKYDYDAIIVGAGPAGITAAIYLKRANLNVLVVERDAPGGQLNKTSSIENYPGFINVTGPDLAFKFYEQLKSMNIPYKYGEVKEIINENNHKKVIINDEELITKAIILTVGRKPKKFEDKKEERYEGNGISFCALCDAPLYKNQDVAIVGGGNSALEEAIYLSEICNKVYIIHRRDELRGDKILISKILEKDNIEIIYNSEINKFKGENKLEELELTINNEKKNIKVQACFIFIGYEPATEFLKNLDILDEKGYIIVDESNKTSKELIYAAGDATKKEVYQIVTAQGEAATAAVTCIKELGSKEW